MRNVVELSVRASDFDRDSPWEVVKLAPINVRLKHPTETFVINQPEYLTFLTDVINAERQFSLKSNGRITRRDGGLTVVQIPAQLLFVYHVIVVFHLTDRSMMRRLLKKLPNVSQAYQGALKAVDSTGLNLRAIQTILAHKPTPLLTRDQRIEVVHGVKHTNIYMRSMKIRGRFRVESVEFDLPTIVMFVHDPLSTLIHLWRTTEMALYVNRRKVEIQEEQREDMVKAIKIVFERNLSLDEAVFYANVIDRKG